MVTAVPTQSLGHILIVDDNEMNREVLSRRLERQGYTFVPAEDGVQALDLLRTQKFDIVLLDIMMPRMNGYQVLEVMKSDPTLGDTPVIVVSAVSELESIVRCVELGAEDYLFKPFNPVLLKARLTAILEKSKLRQAAKAEINAAKAKMQSSLDALKSDAQTLLAEAAHALNADQRQIVSRMEQTVDSLMQSLVNR
jgi:CheY-like chemotaxis protein